MKLFSKLFNKNKKEEFIDIDKINKKEEIILDKLVLYKDENKEDIKQEEKKEINFSLTLQKLSSARKEISSIYHEYYLCKIFSRVSLPKIEFDSLVKSLDKQMNSLDSDLHDIERNVEFYNKINNKVKEEEIRLDDKVDKLLFNEKLIKLRFKDINNTYYSWLKITTVNVCLNKTNDELDSFYKLINNIINKYKNMSDACYDLYYSSGEFIVDLVNNIIYGIKLTNNIDYINKYNYSFFLESDVVLTLDINEWIELYNKVKFAYKLISNIEIDAYLKIKEKYTHFEAVYTLLMMQTEMSRK